ncbi:pentatricopeptide repeat-containing protein [Iris pallida]|uniref:Pentatricopeptide repeat-containing protein n=1 Tax=Iris pallida TaxID=29817 RepID=A0AAX6E2F7_IRIPA|nr:pentatricopeptide repeat-containing protein [Iris pallida]
MNYTVVRNQARHESPLPHNKHNPRSPVMPSGTTEQVDHLSVRKLFPYRRPLRHLLLQPKNLVEELLRVNKGL